MTSVVRLLLPISVRLYIEWLFSCRGRQRKKTLSGWLRLLARSNGQRSWLTARVPTFKGADVLRFSQVAEVETAITTSSGSFPLVALITSTTNGLYSEVALYACWATPQGTVRFNNLGIHLRPRRPRAGKQSRLRRTGCGEILFLSYPSGC